MNTLTRKWHTSWEIRRRRCRDVFPSIHWHISTGWGFRIPYFVGFGWGRPVEINPANFRKRRRDELLVSLAGVVMNLIIAVIFAFVAKILLAVLGYSFLSGTFGNILWTMVIDIVIINLALMIFNLIPCPPLDGFSVITEIFNLKTTELYWRLGIQYGNWILIALMILVLPARSCPHV